MFGEPPDRDLKGWQIMAIMVMLILGLIFILPIMWYIGAWAIQLLIWWVRVLESLPWPGLLS